jgi:hypothetical protein
MDVIACCDVTLCCLGQTHRRLHVQPLPQYRRYIFAYRYEKIYYV